MHHFSFRMGMLTQARATGIYQVTSSPFYCDQELMKCKLREMLAIVPGTKTELKAKKKKKKIKHRDLKKLCWHPLKPGI